MGQHRPLGWDNNDPLFASQIHVHFISQLLSRIVFVDAGYARASSFHITPKRFDLSGLWHDTDPLNGTPRMTVYARTRQIRKVRTVRSRRQLTSTSVGHWRQPRDGHVPCTDGNSPGRSGLQFHGRQRASSVTTLRPLPSPHPFLRGTVPNSVRHVVCTRR